MHVLIDADALPRAIKDIIFRAVRRVRVKWTMFTNKRLYTPSGLDVGMVLVGQGPDEADDAIVAAVEKGDLVVTSDIPLADRVIGKGGFALSPKGDFFDPANIKSRLATRNLLDQLRSEGSIRCGGAPFDAKNAQDFSNQLDRFLTRRLKEEASQQRQVPGKTSHPRQETKRL